MARASVIRRVPHIKTRLPKAFSPQQTFQPDVGRAMAFGEVWCQVVDLERLGRLRSPAFPR
eukprot:1727155-Lingulodinium_polyedra.AAC.1